ncbi:hypothetical protein OXX80_008628 [Metschnikowia pulcherrima]
MSVPILTIPETAFNPAGYLPAKHARRSRLLRYMLTLTRTSAAALILAYLVGLLAIKPLMETTTTQRIEFLEACRTRLRALYINVMGRVEYIPTIGIERSHGVVKKVYADSVCQTEDLEKKQLAEKPLETLGQASVSDKLSLLLTKLQECSAYSVQDIEHYRVVDFSLKDLRQKSEMVYFDQNKLFSEQGQTRKPRHLAREVKQDIRSIKGMFMSGRA